MRILYSYPRWRARGVMRRVMVGLAVVAALAMTSIAAAQTSGKFDLACRGTLAPAGGLILYGNQGFAVISSLGQPGVGVSAATNIGLRAGYIQPDAPAAQTQTAIQIDNPDLLQQGHTVYLTIVSVMAPVLRICNWF